MTSAQPAVSVILCTRNRAEWLGDAIASIVDDSSRVQRELIIVDNGSTDSTRATVDAWLDKVDWIRCVSEPRVGLSRARNTGILAAVGELILFTDDDVMVSDGWADTLTAAFTDRDVVGAAGRIVHEWLAPPPTWMRPPHANMVTLVDRGTERHVMSAEEFPIGANMAVRRDALPPGQPFDPSSGNRGRLSFGYEEVTLFLHMQGRGTWQYEPSAVVCHRVLPARATWEALRRRHWQDGFGRARAERGWPGSTGRRPLTERTGATAHSLLETGRARWSGRSGRTADQAEREFNAYWQLGHCLEDLLASAPKLADLLARHGSI